ncbi:MAG: extracellular solute-binding protein [Clostridiales bacterium]|nr:extracellular solute-binding protein [Clostridiales bacterium]
MKHTRMTAIVLALLMTASALLTLGCGNGEEKLEIEGMWRGELIELDENFSSGRYMIYSDGKVCICGSTYDENGGTPTLMFYDGENATYQTLDGMSDNVRGFVNTSYGYVFYNNEFNFETREEKKSFVAFSDGLLIWELAADEIFDMSNNPYSDVLFTARGSEIIAAFDKQLAIIDADGKLVKQLDLDIAARKLVANNSGEVLVIGVESMVYQLSDGNEMSAVSGEDYTDIINSTIVSSSVGEFCYSDKTGVSVVYSDVGAKQLLNFVSTGISTSANNVEFCVAAEDEMYMYGSDGLGGARGLWKYTPVPADEIPERTIIRIAYRETGSNKIPLAAVKFNKSQSQYYIMPVEYEYASPDDDAAMTRLDADIVSGKVGDIIWVQNYDDVVKYTSSGAFVDLSKYMDTSDIFGCVIDMCTIDGKLAALPQDFYVYSMLVKKGDPIADGGFTMSDFIDGYNSGRRIYCDMSKGSMMSALVQCSLYSCIDTEKNTCDFTGFKELLEFVNQLPDVDAGAINQYDGNHYATGEIAMYDYGITDFNSWAHKDYIFDGEGELLGAPTMSGEQLFRVDSSSGYYGISASSKQKEGAAEFLKFILSGENTLDVMRGMRYIPASKSAYDHVADPANEGYTEYAFFYKESLTRTSGSSRPFEERDDGWGVHIDKAMIAEMREFLDGVKVLKPLPEKIMDIVVEEMGDYMSGKIDSDEFIKRLEDRVGTYLAERK